MAQAPCDPDSASSPGSQSLGPAALREAPPSAPRRRPCLTGAEREAARQVPTYRPRAPALRGSPVSSGPVPLVGRRRGSASSRGAPSPPVSNPCRCQRRLRGERCAGPCPREGLRLVPPRGERPEVVGGGRQGSHAGTGLAEQRPPAPSPSGLKRPSLRVATPTAVCVRNLTVPAPPAGT